MQLGRSTINGKTKKEAAVQHQRPRKGKLRRRTKNIKQENSRNKSGNKEKGGAFWHPPLLPYVTFYGTFCLCIFTISPPTRANSLIPNTISVLLHYIGTHTSYSLTLLGIRNFQPLPWTRYSRTRKMHHTTMVTRTPTGSLRDVWPTSGSWQCCPLNPVGQEHTYPVCLFSTIMKYLKKNCLLF